MDNNKVDEYLLEVGRRMRKARMNKNLTQAELATIIGASRSLVNAAEVGKAGLRVDTLRRTCDVLDVDADWLLGIKPRSFMTDDKKTLYQVREIEIADIPTAPDDNSYLSYRKLYLDQTT